MHCTVDVALRFSLRRQGRILMETVVVATRTCAWQPEQSLAVPMEIADCDIAVATRDDIPGLVVLQELRLVFRIEHGFGPRQMEKMRSIHGGDFLT